MMMTMILWIFKLVKIQVMRVNGFMDFFTRMMDISHQ